MAKSAKKVNGLKNSKAFGLELRYQVVFLDSQLFYTERTINLV
jgi:hypothetical protein